jgi:hypothetical protein
MSPLTLQAEQVIPAFNNLSALQPWLRPGFISFAIGAHIEQLAPVAVRISGERAAMLDEVAARYPDAYADDEPDESLRGKPHPKAGQPIVVNNITLFKSSEAGEEFRQREKDMMSKSIEFAITDDLRLTIDLLKKLDNERLPAPRMMNGVLPKDSPTVDFSTLMPLLVQTVFTKDGIKAPQQS